MQVLRDITSNLASLLENSDWQDFTLHSVGGTLLASSCAYGGTFVFKRCSPRIGAIYFGTVALITQLAYRALEELKKRIDSPFLKRVISTIQLLQIPVYFYYFHGLTNPFLTAQVKLEIISATAHFIAIPVFFLLVKETYNDPSVANIGTTLGIMLTLVDKLKAYAV